VGAQGKPGVEPLGRAVRVPDVDRQAIGKILGAHAADNILRFAPAAEHIGALGGRGQGLRKARLVGGGGRHRFVNGFLGAVVGLDGLPSVALAPAAPGSQQIVGQLAVPGQIHHVHGVSISRRVRSHRVLRPRV